MLCRFRSLHAAVDGQLVPPLCLQSHVRENLIRCIDRDYPLLECTADDETAAAASSDPSAKSELAAAMERSKQLDATFREHAAFAKAKANDPVPVRGSTCPRFPAAVANDCLTIFFLDAPPCRLKCSSRYMRTSLMPSIST